MIDDRRISTKMRPRRSTARRVISTVVIGAVVASGVGLLAAPGRISAVQAASAPTWVSQQGKTVKLTLIAGYNTVNSGFNFNGAAHGQMVVTVPLGAKIEATFINKAQGAVHNAVIIPYTSAIPASATTPAFTGAASPAMQFGPGSFGAAAKPQSFSFTASKAGSYLIVCGIAGHALAGMWDTLIVSPTASTASVSFNGSSAAPSATSAAVSAAAKAHTWVMTSGSTVHLTLISNFDNNNGGFNFNGASNGQMTVTVPLGAKVVAVYSNIGSTPHDVRIINYQKPLPSHTVALAFSGAGAGFLGGGRGGPGGSRGGQGAPPRGGGFPQMSNKPMTFTFTANKVGTYMIMCGFPGHAIAGMWDVFVVSKTATTASVQFS